MERSVRPRILIVDSYKSHSAILSDHLKELSPAIEIDSATEGREALSIAATKEVHFFLIHGFLKGPLNAFELCREVRRLDEYQHTPVILMLSGHLIHDHARGLAAGADLFLHVPVEKQELWRMVVLLLNEASHGRKPTAASVKDAEVEVIEFKPTLRLLH